MIAERTTLADWTVNDNVYSDVEIAVRGKRLAIDPVDAIVLSEIILDVAKRARAERSTR